MKRIALIALVLALAAPGPAQAGWKLDRAKAIAALLPTTAQAWAPPTDSARLAAFLPIARAAWPGSPCKGHETMQIVALAGDVLGEQDPGTCNVRIANGMSAEELCSVLVHELGHAAGYGHTDDPLVAHAPAGPWANIMRSTATGIWYACDPPSRTYAPHPQFPVLRRHATRRSLELHAH